MAKKTKQDLYFVNIEDPLNFRRELLQSIKLMLTLLKDSEKLNLIRKKKLIKFKEIHQSIEDINSIYKQFKIHLPKLPKKHSFNNKVTEDISSTKEKIIIPKKDSSELDKLEEELRNVEEELKKLK